MNFALSRQSSRTICSFTLLGGLIGWLILHPLSQLIAFWSSMPLDPGRPNRFILHLLGSLESGMLPMTVLFIALGAGVGIGFAAYEIVLNKKRSVLVSLESKLARDLPSILKQGERETIEFKSSGRWDYRLKNVNKSLVFVLVKTIAGFMNHNGGDLIVGVNDEGIPVGLSRDYETLNHKNRDGFERWIMANVKSRLGGEHCAKSHCVFYEIDGRDICRVLVEASSVPVYLKDGKTYRYFIRTGNSTCELNAKETVAHVASRQLA